MTANKKKNIKRQNITQLVLSLIIIVLVNVIGSYVFKRFDLTAEKRYTLTPATQKLIEDLDDIVFFKVYLDGEFPAGFKRLRNETREMLNQFRAYSKNIEYEFINPSAEDPQTRKNLYQQLVSQGLEPTNLQVKTNEGQSQQIIFPGAIATYKERNVPLQLLMSQIGVPPEAVLNNSIQALEYNISSAIRKLSIGRKPKIAFIEGHGELGEGETYDIRRALSEFYSVESVTLDEKIKSLTDRSTIDSTQATPVNKYKAIVIAKPERPFSEKDKFIIDQFIMNGGKVLWLIDPVFTSMDSLERSNQTFGISQNLNLANMLFKYGIKLHPNLLLDLNALPIPIVTGQIGQQPQLSLLPWYFFPILVPSTDHPVVKNLNAIKTEFISSLDTVGVKGLSKTILLTTSRYSRSLPSPVTVDLKIMEEQPDERLYNQPFQPVAVLVEGEFESLYKNRLTDTLARNAEIAFRNKSTPTKMIVISDGDVIKNQIDRKQGMPLPLGYDQWTKQTFGNRDFILNAVNYLCDDSGLLKARTKDLTIRLLDKTKVEKNKLLWQILNILLPILLVIVAGVVIHFVRTMKYRRG